MLMLIMLAPAILLAGVAQLWIRSAYARGMEEPAPISGAEAARLILDDAGLNDVPIEEAAGMLSDHYDPSDKVVRLSSEVFHSHSLSAVGIAAHEVGHAIQDARGYLPLVLRNAAVPAATFGPWGSIILLTLGAALASAPLIVLGILCFCGIVIFQLINLPVEFDASARAKRLLGQLGIVDSHGAGTVNSVLNAAALTYVAATLQSVLQLAYYVIVYGGILRSDDDR